MQSPAFPTGQIGAAVLAVWVGNSVHAFVLPQRSSKGFPEEHCVWFSGAEFDILLGWVPSFHFTGEIQRYGHRGGHGTERPKGGKLK